MKLLKMTLGCNPPNVEEAKTVFAAKTGYPLILTKFRQAGLAKNDK